MRHVSTWQSGLKRLNPLPFPVWSWKCPACFLGSLQAVKLATWNFFALFCEILSCFYWSLPFCEEKSFAIFCFFTVAAKVEDSRPKQRPPRRPRKPKTLNNPEDSTYYTLIHVSLASFCWLRPSDNSHLNCLSCCPIPCIHFYRNIRLCPPERRQATDFTLWTGFDIIKIQFILLRLICTLGQANF